MYPRSTSQFTEVFAYDKARVKFADLQLSLPVINIHYGSNEFSGNDSSKALTQYTPITRLLDAEGIPFRDPLGIALW